MNMRNALPWLLMAVIMLVLMGSDLGALKDKAMMMLVIMVILMGFWMRSRKN